MSTPSTPAQPVTSLPTSSATGSWQITSAGVVQLTGGSIRVGQRAHRLFQESVVLRWSEEECILVPADTWQLIWAHVGQARGSRFSSRTTSSAYHSLMLLEDELVLFREALETLRRDTLEPIRQRLEEDAEGVGALSELGGLGATAVELAWPQHYRHVERVLEAFAHRVLQVQTI